jgi:hypothetical protein
MVMDTIVINGIVTANFVFEISKKDFASACKSVGLSTNFRTFTDEQWTTVRQALREIVVENEDEIDYDSVHDTDTIVVDEVVIKDRDITSALFDKDGKLYSIENT